MKNTITGEKFAAVKSFIEAGATYKDVKKFYGLAADTVSRIKATQTYEEYRNRCLSDSQRKLAKAKARAKATSDIEKITKPAVTTQPAVTVPSPLFQQDVRELLKEQNTYLKLISSKLAYIVEQLS